MENTVISWKLCLCAYGILRRIEKNNTIMRRIDLDIGDYINETLVHILEAVHEFISNDKNGNAIVAQNR